MAVPVYFANRTVLNEYFIQGPSTLVSNKHHRDINKPPIPGGLFRYIVPALLKSLFMPGSPGSQPAGTPSPVASPY